jgi:hypothetical protein
MVEISEWVEEHLHNLYGRAVSVSDKGLIQIDEKELKKVSSFLQKELVREVVNENDLPWRGHVWNNLNHFLEKATIGDVMVLPRDFKILKDRDRFLVMRETDLEDLNAFKLDTTTPVSLKVGGHNFTMDLTIAPSEEKVGSIVRTMVKLWPPTFKETGVVVSSLKALRSSKSVSRITRNRSRSLRILKSLGKTITSPIVAFSRKWLRLFQT